MTRSPSSNRAPAVPAWYDEARARALSLLAKVKGDDAMDHASFAARLEIDDERARVLRNFMLAEQLAECRTQHGQPGQWFIRITGRGRLAAGALA